jgi:hypothetical protein
MKSHKLFINGGEDTAASFSSIHDTPSTIHMSSINNRANQNSEMNTSVKNKKASSAKTVGGNWCLITSKLRKPLESCPQQADSRMGL